MEKSSINDMRYVLLSCVFFLTLACSKAENPVNDYAAIKKSWMIGSHLKS